MDSHPFMSIHPLILMIELFKYFTFKIQGQSHSSSSHKYNILSTHIPLIPCWSALPFLRCSYSKNWPWKSKVKVMGEVLRYSIFKIWPWKSRVKVMGEVNLKSQCGSNILSTHIPFVPCQSGIPFLSYNVFKIWPWKSRGKVMGDVTIQSHNVGLASYRLASLSFHVNRPSHSWDTAFSKFDLENQGSRSNDPDGAQLQV